MKALITHKLILSCVKYFNKLCDVINFGDRGKFTNQCE